MGVPDQVSLRIFLLFVIRLLPGKFTQLLILNGVALQLTFEIGVFGEQGGDHLLSFIVGNHFFGVFCLIVIASASGRAVFGRGAAGVIGRTAPIAFLFKYFGITFKFRSG